MTRPPREKDATGTVSGVTTTKSTRGDASDRAVRVGLPRWIAGVTLAFSAVLFFAFATHGTFNPLYQVLGPGYADDFFSAQAHSLVHGHLAVNPAQLPGECWIHDHRCYGYFGLTASVLRLPFLAFIPAAHESLTVIFLTVALLLSVGSALAIIYRVLAQVRRTRLTTFFGLALAIGLGPGSLLIMIDRPAMYEETIAWATGFALLGIYCFMRWWDDRRRVWGAALVASMVLGANARPTVVAVAVVLGAGIVIDALVRWRHGTAAGADRRGAAEDRGLPRRQILLGLAVAVLPVVTCFGVYWLKFHTFLPSQLFDQQVSGPEASPYWLALRRVDHNSLSAARFIPTDLLAYIRPDGLAVQSSFPFVDFRFGPATGLGLSYLGLPVGGILVEPWSTLPDDMPWAVVIVVAALAYCARRYAARGLKLAPVLRSLLRSPMTYCIVAGLGAWAVTLTQCYITNRYLTDAMPLIVVAVAASARVLAPSITSLTGRRAAAFIGAVTVLVVVSLLINVGLEYRDWWNVVA